jgi:two-component system chemotaxis response regulator CheY
MARKKAILIVDDIEYHRRANARIVEAALPGAAIIFALDGRLGLHIAQTERPDLIITDLSMPAMNGLDMIRAIRRDKSLAGVPIIVVTNLESDLVRSQALARGANAFVGKSEVDERLPGIVREMLAEHEAKSGADEPEP